MNEKCLSRSSGFIIIKKCCSLLTDSGCLYSLEKRPSGGVNLIPDENGCYQLVNQKEAILK